MIVYHGTTKAHSEAFLQDGIDAHLPIHRSYHHPLTADVPGLFVAPTLAIADRFGRAVVAISINPDDLQLPPHLAASGVTFEEAWANPREPQALLVARIEPTQITRVCMDECQGK